MMIHYNQRSSDMRINAHIIQLFGSLAKNYSDYMLKINGNMQNPHGLKAGVVKVFVFSMCCIYYHQYF